MINLTEKAREICQHLEKKGFGGIYIQAYVEEQHREDFDNEEEFEKWKRDYVIFVVEPHYPVIDQKYMEFNQDQFDDELKDYIVDLFGNDITVNYYCKGREIEVQRKAIINVS